METLGDLARAGCQIVTIGQYLSPGPKHLPVDRFVTPEQFEAYRGCTAKSERARFYIRESRAGR